MTYIDNVDAHLSNDGQQAHQFARTVGQARVDDKVATGSRQAVLDEATDKIDIDISPC